MSKQDIDKMKRRLEAVLAGERREAMVYTLLTVLCTPAFVAIASLVIASVLVYVMHRSEYPIDNAWAIYTGMTLFLASAVGLAGASMYRSSASPELNPPWLAGAAVFLSLLGLTYATPLQETRPAFFGIAYCVLWFLTLGLIGHTHMSRPPDGPLGHRPTPHAFVLAVAGFIVSAYAELLSASWLWVPPKPHEVRVAARMLCRLAAQEERPLQRSVVDDRVERLLVRLKLVQEIDGQLHLTPKGIAFVQSTGDV